MSAALDKITLPYAGLVVYASSFRITFYAMAYGLGMLLVSNQ